MQKTTQKTDEKATENRAKTEIPPLQFETIFSYSRREAIEDGVLVDVTDFAKGSGFSIPVAITEALHATLQPKAGDSAQDFEGRLHDLLMILRIHIKSQRAESDTVHFKFILNNKGTQYMQRAWSKVDGGDDGSPVLTIMLEGED